MKHALKWFWNQKLSSQGLGKGDPPYENIQGEETKIFYSHAESIYWCYKCYFLLNRFALLACYRKVKSFVGLFLL